MLGAAPRNFHGARDLWRPKRRRRPRALLAGPEAPAKGRKVLGGPLFFQRPSGLAAGCGRN